MVPCAPRYRLVVLSAIETLDDRDVPIAEVTRRVGEVAERHGVPRPSYVHLRRLVRAKREREDAEAERRKELRAIATGVVGDVLVGRFVDPYEVADRVARVRAR